MLSGGKVIVFLTGLLQYLAKNIALYPKQFGDFFCGFPYTLQCVPHDYRASLVIAVLSFWLLLGKILHKKLPLNYTNGEF